MIVVDTSALIAVALGEPAAEACGRALRDAQGSTLVSAGTLAEALIVALGRSHSAQLSELLALVDPEVVPVTPAFAHRMANAYALWGKGHHAARLNLGDCFAYALARERGLPLLYVGADFAQTDVASALPGAAPP